VAPAALARPGARHRGNSPRCTADCRARWRDAAWLGLLLRATNRREQTLPLTITRAQRDAIYEMVINHLSGIGDVWICVERGDLATAKALGRDFAEDLRLLEEYVSSRQLVVPWGERRALLRDEERAARLEQRPRSRRQGADGGGERGACVDRRARRLRRRDNDLDERGRAPAHPGPRGRADPAGRPASIRLPRPTRQHPPVTRTPWSRSHGHSLRPSRRPWSATSTTRRRSCD
jgi:hypothetical protein